MYSNLSIITFDRLLQIAKTRLLILYLLAYKPGVL